MSIHAAISYRHDTSGKVTSFYLLQTVSYGLTVSKIIRQGQILKQNISLSVAKGKGRETRQCTTVRNLIGRTNKRYTNITS